MARRSEPKVIHPITMLESLSAFKDDANGLHMAVRHAVSFLEDGTLDPAKVVNAIVPQLKEAMAKYARWNEPEA